jgi:4-amino-4-deoxy-L-arabinose transferase-like glycosyltransferase
MSEPTQNNIQNFLQPLIKRMGLVTAIVALALLVRVAYVLMAPQVDPILRRDPLYGDASGYHLLAVNLLKGLGLTWDGQMPTSYRMPGYPAFVALVYALLGVSPQAVGLVQAFLGALVCIPVYAIGNQLGGWRLAGLSALGVALHPILIYMTAWVYSETLFLLLMWLGIWALVRLISNPMWSLAVAAGVLLGLSVLVRSEIAWFPILLAGWFAMFAKLRPLV